MCFRLPDILKQIGGIDFDTVDHETGEKILTWELPSGKAISFKEICTLYQTLDVSQHEKRGAENDLRTKKAINNVGTAESYSNRD